MANAKKCDLCHEYYDINPHQDCGFRTFYDDHNLERRIRLNRECCPTCMKKINDCINSLIKPIVREEKQNG